MKRPLAYLGVAFLSFVFLFKSIGPDEVECLFDSNGDKTQELIGTLGMWKETDNGFSLEILNAKPLEDIERQPKRFNIIAYMDSGEIPELGCKVLIKGQPAPFSVARNPGEFNQRDYYKARGFAYRLFDAQIVRSAGHANTLQQALLGLRFKLRDIYERLLPDEKAGVISAMILGDKSIMDPEIKTLYSAAGIAHALAISGLHISILGYGLYRLLKALHVPRAPAFLICMGLLCLYAIMTGSNVPAIRALTMFCLNVAADILKRSYDLISAFSLSGIIILLYNPNFIFDAGFLLSFGAVMGIGIVYPVLSDCFLGKPTDLSNTSERDKINQSFQKILKTITSSFLISISISIFSLPITLYFFYQIPIYSCFLNLIIIPLLGLLVTSAILMGGLGLLFLPLGVLFSLPCSILLFIYEKACRISLKLPGSIWILGRPRDVSIILYYVILLIGLYALKFICKKLGKRGLKTMFIALFMGLIALMDFNPHPGMEIAMLDIGQGDCIVLKHGRSADIIDCGSTTKKEIAKYTVIPYLKSMGIRKIGNLIMTHSDADHINGFMEMFEMEDYEKLPTGSLIVPDIGYEDENYQEIKNKAKAEGLKIIRISSGMEFEKELGGLKLILRCLNPSKGYITDNPNEYSTVLEAEYGDFKALFTGDIVGNPEIDMIPKIRGPLTLLKCAHHGSRFSTGEDFLEKARPYMTFISCGENNRYGHPHEETLMRLYNIGSRVYQTPKSGAITCVTDGKKVRIHEFLGGN